MVKLKQIYLKNYCGYKEGEFDFTENGKVKQLACFCGPNGCGKCVTGDTYVIGKTGMKRMDSIFEGKDLKDDTWYESKSNIFTGQNIENVKNIYFNGKKNALNIITSRGYTVTGSKDNHKVLGVVNGKIDFVKLTDLKEGDFVCIQRGSPFASTNNISLGEASLLGYLISEGYLSKKYGVVFTNTDDEVIEIVDKLFKKYLPQYNSSIVRRKSSSSSLTIKSISFNNKQSINYLSKIISFDLSGDKRVPDCVLGGSKNVIIAFLRAYFEGDGGIIKGTRTVSCASKSYELMHQIQLLLLRLGIISSVRKKKSKLNYTKKYKDGYVCWVLDIHGREIFKYDRIIGFDSTRKKAELKNVIDVSMKRKCNPNKDIIPVDMIRPLVNMFKERISELPSVRKKGGYFSRSDYGNSSNGLHVLQKNYLNLVKKGVSRYKVKKCIRTIYSELKKFSKDVVNPHFNFLDNKYFFDTVQEIKPVVANLYDVSVDEEHKYWSNGFISHNSTLLQAIETLCNAYRYYNKDTKLLFRKCTYSNDYDPSYYDPSSKEGNKMELQGVFATDRGDKEVVITTDGVQKNELFRKDRMSFHYLIDADSPLNSYKFQLHAEMKERFLELAKIVYELDCYMGSGLPDLEDAGQDFYTDFVVEKKDKNKNITKVHFKRFSGGERKIATLLRDLCNPLYMDDNDIILIDNICKEIYFSRHARMINKILEIFKDKQIFITTHSAVLVGLEDDEMNINIPSYLPEKYLYNIDEIK